MTSKRYLSTMAQQIRPYTLSFGEKGQIRFNTNTQSAPPPSLERFLRDFPEKEAINEYPDPSYTRLRTLIAEYEGVPLDMITITNGGDEAIDMVSKAALNTGDAFITAPPTFEVFASQSTINGGRHVPVPLIPDSFAYDIPEIQKQAHEHRAKLLFICNPNNPTGSVISNSDIEMILSSFDGLVIVDEVYREFYGTSATSLISRYDNLIILRSFSKFAGIAGARVGYLITNPELSSVFDSIRFPMGVSALSALLAEYVLTYDRDWIQKRVHMIRSERDRLKPRLESFGYHVYPSQTNFFLVRIGEQAAQITAALASRDLLISARHTAPGLEGCVRITIRSPEENDQLIAALNEIEKQ